MRFSYSTLKRFTTCPRQYHEINVLKNFKDIPNDKTIYGKEVHKAIEDYIRSGIALPANYGFKHIVDNILAIIPKGKADVEVKLAVNGEMEPIPYDYTDPTCVMWGIIDYLVIEKDGTAWLLDWKLGNSLYADLKQLNLLALLVFYCYPQVKLVKSFLMFLLNQRFIPNKDYYREDIPSLWEGFAAPLTRLAFSEKTNSWPPNPSGLCRKHCPVKTCVYCGP